jgi:hypothetical protein
MTLDHSLDYGYGYINRVITSCQSLEEINFIWVNPSAFLDFENLRLMKRMPNLKRVDLTNASLSMDQIKFYKSYMPVVNVCG